jgi:hypothetical protein
VSTRYIVEIDLRTVGSTDFGAKHVERGAIAAQKYQASLQRAGAAAAGLHGQLMGVADRAVGVAAGFAKWAAFGAGAAGIGAITFGVMGLNNQLEKSQIALGAIFQAQGVSPTLNAGLQLAGGTIEKMRADAAKLPGEFTDLLNIFTTASVPALRSGAGVQQFADLSARAMAAGAVASMPLDQVAREFAMLLEGRSGAHNVFGMRLLGLAGDAAEAFNKKTAPERFALISKELNKYGDALEAFGGSFEGKWTTAIDNAKNLLRLGTAPLFEKGKDALGAINEWLTSPAALRRAENLGRTLADGFEWAKAKLDEWLPSIEKFATNAWVKLSDLWVQALPYVERFSAALKTALEDPGTIDKLIRLLELYVAAKLGGGVLSVAATVGGAAAPFARGWGGRAAAGAAGAAGAGVAAKTAAGFGLGVGGKGAATLGLGAGAGVLGTVAAVGAAAGGVAAFGNQLWQLGKDIQSSWKPGMSLWAAARNPSQERMAESRNWKIPEWAGGGVWADQADQGAIVEWADREVEAHYRTIQGLDAMRDRLADLQREAEMTGRPLSILRAEMYEHALKTAEVRAELEGLSTAADDAATMLANLAGTDAGVFSQEADLVRRLNSRYTDPAAAKGAGGGARHGGGGGGTHIQKVEIVVTSNQDPSRVARATVDELGKLASFRRSSRYVPNYSQAPR